MSRFVQNGRVVTNALPGESLHNYGLAFDIYEIKKGKYITTLKNQIDLYKSYFKPEGFLWGGNWKKFVDGFHFYVEF